ncbi:MAG: hypothetical protein AAFY02_16455 [Pseudomonadota bacterium]
MKAIKAAVIIMAVLLVLGFGFVAVTIIGRLSGDQTPEVRGDVTLAVPDECRLADAWSAGGLLYLRLSGPRACDLILLVDPDSQKEFGRIALSNQSDRISGPGVISLEEWESRSQGQPVE